MGETSRKICENPGRWIGETLESLRSKSLYRELISRERREGLFYTEKEGEMRDFSSNDYLALSEHQEVKHAASEAVLEQGSSSSASRLVTGTFESHTQLEKKIASWIGTESCLIFGSGYHVNTGVIPALVGRNDLILADRLCHASIIDGAVLSRAKLKRFAHNDLAELESLLRMEREEREDIRILVATESVFSMDGDSPDLRALSELAERFSAWLLVDEAHALGVFGEKGRGLLGEVGFDPNTTLITGTFSKALGSFGGLVCCSREFSELLINRARSFIYSTALPPASVAAADCSLNIIQNNRLGDRLLENARYFRDSLKNEGLNTGIGDSHIVPVIVGESERALRLARKLREDGFLVSAMRAPTVPEGEARLRISLNLNIRRKDCDLLVSALVNYIRDGR